MFGERLRRLRLERGLKQSDLADDHGLSASYISRLEVGSRPASAHVAAVLADRLGVEVTAFMGNRDANVAGSLAQAQANLAIGNQDAAVALLEEALAQVGPASLPLQWTIRQSIATALSNLGRFEEWREHQAALVELAREAAAPALVVQAAVGMANCLRLAGDVLGAYASAGIAYDAAVGHGVARELRIEALIALVAAEVEAGRATEAIQHVRELLESVDATVSGPLRAQARWAAATTLASRGLHDEACDLMDVAMAELRSGEDLITWARLRLAAVSLRQRADRAPSDEWRASFGDAATVLRLAGIPVYEAQLAVIEARLAAEEGRAADALALCEAALERSGVLSFRDRARTRMLRAQLVARLGEADRGLADLREVATDVTEAGAMELSAEAWRLVADLAMVGRDGAAGDVPGSPPGRRKGPRRTGHATTD